MNDLNQIRIIASSRSRISEQSTYRRIVRGQIGVSGIYLVFVYGLHLNLFKYKNIIIFKRFLSKIYTYVHVHRVHHDN